MVTPVSGIILITPATIMNVCMPSMPATPQPSSRSNERRERMLTDTLRTMISTYTAITQMPNTMPSCSQITAKMKSFQ